MSSSTLPRGSYLLLFPEDLDHPSTSPVYAKEKRQSRRQALTGNGPRAKVPNSDAEGLKLRTWIRQAVCVSSGGQFRYGHVTGYSESGVIIIHLKFEPRSATTIHERHHGSAAASYTSTEPCSLISVAQLMKDLLPDVSPGFDCVYKWVDDRSGKRVRISLQHVDGGKAIPANIEGSFGSTFCEVPDAHTITATSRTCEPHEPDTTRNSSSFFDVTAVNDDDEAAADEALLATSLLSGINEPVEQPHSFRYQVPTSATARRIIHQAIPGNIVEESSEDVEIRDLIRVHKPHLLPYLLKSKRIASSGAKRPAASTEDNTSIKRSKFSFTPSAEQREIHDAVTSAAYRGKSPTTCVESMVSNTQITLWAYPSVAMRAYDLQFGSRGLSFLHFAPVDQLVRLQRQRENFINMSDSRSRQNLYRHRSRPRGMRFLLELLDFNNTAQ
ncbi:hypothetical protein GQ600_16634 [Phytophthora cactorum]|nr:hypothetical protein GQ600_16634 [Phytophthora cactorum]